MSHRSWGLLKSTQEPVVRKRELKCFLTLGTEKAGRKPFKMMAPKKTLNESK